MSTPVLPGGSARALRPRADQVTATVRSSCDADMGIASERRVREQARDVAVLMSFSAAVSVGFAVALLLITSLGG